MRLLLVGAFPFPHEQGSQVYFQEQALALHAAGAEVHLLTYGPGRSAAARSPDRTDSLADLPQTTLPAWTTPRTRRSGPNLGKPLADLALTFALRRLVASGQRDPGRFARRAGDEPERASSSASFFASRIASNEAPSASSSASRSASSWRATRTLGALAGFDAILAHHAEGALSALHGLPRARPPILYCAHTLLGQELPLYFESGSNADPSDRGVPHRAVADLGNRLDRWIARRADGWIALTQASERVMRASSPAPGRRIGPPVADPSGSEARRDDARVLAANGLAPRRFFLYCGNLDPYQDLPLLEQVAQGRVTRAAPLPLVVATHAFAAAEGRSDPGARLHSGARGLARRLEQAGVRMVSIGSAAEARALFAGARATIVPRRSLGGFPIKLVNSLAAGTPVVAFQGDEWGLVDGHEGLIADPDDPIPSLAAALSRLELDPALAERLGRGARARYGAEHRPALTAAATLELIRAVVERGER